MSLIVSGKLAQLGGPFRAADAAGSGLSAERSSGSDLLDYFGGALFSFLFNEKLRKHMNQK